MTSDLPSLIDQTTFHTQIRDLGTCHIVYAVTPYELNSSGTDPLNWAIQLQGQTVQNCCQNWLLPYTATPACIACHSVHWRCQKVKWWPMKGGLHSCGCQGQSAHSIHLCFCTTPNPLGLFPGHFTRLPTTRKLNRGVAPASEGILMLPEFR